MLMRYSGAYVVGDLTLMRLSVSKVGSLNDPFELHMKRGKEMTQREARLYVERAHKRKEFVAGFAAKYPQLGPHELKKRLRDEKGIQIKNLLGSQEHMMRANREQIKISMRHARIMCFADVTDDTYPEIPMWAYYGDSHKGVRFSLSEEFFQRKRYSSFPMEYPDSPPPIDGGLDPRSKEYDEQIKRVLHSKGKAWEDERETRLLIPIGDCFEAEDCSQSRTVREYVKLEPADLIQMDMGINCDIPAEAIRGLREIYPALVVRRGFKDENAYLIKYETVN